MKKKNFMSQNINSQKRIKTQNKNIIITIKLLNHIIQQMGKQKQQQRPKRKKLPTNSHKNERMKQVLQRLAQMKQQNMKVVQKGPSNICQMHGANAKTKKIEKVNKSQKQQSQPEQQPQIVQKPVINIFAVDAYQSQKPVLINNSHQNMKEQHQEDLQSRARKVMGQNFNLDKFGDKPMRIIEENQQAIQMSGDQKQPNSLSTLTHQNISIPQGNKFINRGKQIQQIRQKLPIYMKQQQIIETINTHLVTLVCGETGSGKSTQLPQFLVQKNYQKLGKIAITQPRRLATISLARRVCEQTNYKLGVEIAFQVRHQRKQSQKSFIKFMTDGILLKEMSSDPLLLQYCVIIIDQAHQRKINTDILIGLLSKLVLVRYKMSLQNKCSPLRLIIMSATLRVKDFQNPILFPFPIPILNIDSKMFPVTIFHQRNTPQNYIDCAVKKCVKIHKQLPPGDVLVFLTGKEEINQMMIKLEMGLKRLRVEERDGMDEDEDQGEEIVEGEQMMEQVGLRKNSTGGHANSVTEFIIYPLYSSLPIEQQDKIFKPPKNHLTCPTRKFIISTNIAETSITVPNIRYVIDSGQQKYRYFDNVWKWNKGWGTKAMAAQRAGRAGRTMHGYCYRLYSSALYANIMEQYPDPEICRLPLQSVLLQIKAIGFGNVFAFPFPTPPSNSAIKHSLQNLIQVGAIQGAIQIKETKKKQVKPNTPEPQNPEPTFVITDNCRITQLGKIISFIPLAPKLAKMLLIANKIGMGMEKYIVIIAVLLTVESVFKSKWAAGSPADQLQYGNYDLEDNGKKNLNKMKNMLIQKRKKQLSQFHNKYKQYIDKQSGGDIFIAMNIVGKFLTQIHHIKTLKKSKNTLSHTHQMLQISEQNLHQLIQQQSAKLELNSNTMRQLFYNCDQICQIYQTLTSNKINFEEYSKPKPEQYTSLLQMMLNAYYKNLCRYELNNKYINREQQEVYIHSKSVLYKDKKLFVCCVEFYANVDDANNKSALNSKSNRKYMRYPFRVNNYELLSSFGKIKQPHQYIWKEKQVCGLASGQIFGWQIPNLVIKSLNQQLQGQAKYFAFARFFLSGQVVPCLRILTQKKWLNSSTTIIRPDNLQEKVQRLVRQFRKYDIYSLSKFMAVMRNEGIGGQFLKKQLTLWLNVKNYDSVYQMLRKYILQTQAQ